MFLNIRSVPSQSARFANPVWQAMEGEHEMEELVGIWNGTKEIQHLIG